MKQGVALSALQHSIWMMLLECVTLLINNIYYDNHFDAAKSLALAKSEWDAFTDQDFTLIAVSNEIGWGVIPMDKVSRAFADIQGTLNQYIAASAQSAYALISGIPVTLK